MMTSHLLLPLSRVVSTPPWKSIRLPQVGSSPALISRLLALSSVTLILSIPPPSLSPSLSLLHHSHPLYLSSATLTLSLFPFIFSLAMFLLSIYSLLYNALHVFFITHSLPSVALCAMTAHPAYLIPLYSPPLVFCFILRLHSPYWNYRRWCPCCYGHVAVGYSDHQVGGWRRRVDRVWRRQQWRCQWKWQ